MTDSLGTAFADTFNAMTGNIERVIYGKTDVVRLALVAMLAEGHLLLEDVPGVGKTMLARAISGSVAGSWRRIQFTPDLLPSDVTGVSIYNQRSQQFEFHPGPVFANVVVADEINRASPKTQAALLEVMEERVVTVDGAGHHPPRPFLVIGTQNPIELEGTYRLPEAQLDRFMISTSVGYPDLPAEVEVLRSHSAQSQPVDAIRPVVTAEQVRGLIDFASRIHVSDAAFGYIAAIADATRRANDLRLGVSPRGGLALLKAARVYAAAGARNFVSFDDVNYLAQPVLSHRVILTPEAELSGTTASDVINRVVGSVPVPQSRA